MRVAYLINQYPAISHSFIRREIHALERLGTEVVRIAIRGWDLDLADEEDRAERSRTQYVLRDGAAPLLLAVARMMIRQPVRLVRAFGMAWRLSRNSERPLPTHIIYVAEACRIQPWLRTAGVRHLHAHFGTNSAEVAMLVHALGGPPWSFTAHGTETFDNPGLVGLKEKVTDCAFVVAVSSYGQAQIYRSAAPQYWHKVHLVHCGLDPLFHAMAPAASTFSKRIVCVGRLSPEKGHLLLLEAGRLLTAQEVDFELVLVGDGELRAEIEARISQYGLGSCIHITGWLSAKQVRDEILAARALALPSLGEGLPVVIMEAMALRRPVIATYVGGIPELVRPGQDGWIVPAADAAAFADALRACLAAPAEDITRMGEAARERVLLRHDVDIEARKLQKLFRFGLNPDLQT